MRLTEAQLNDGRERLQTGNPDAFNDWLDAHGIVVDKQELHRTLVGLTPERALDLFNRAFSKMDPELDRTVAYVILTLLVLSTSTGLAYLMLRLMAV